MRGFRWGLFDVRVWALVAACATVAAPAAAAVDTDPPVPRITTSSRPTGLQSVAFAEPVLGVSNDNPSLRTEEGAENIASVRCRDAAARVVGCAGTDVFGVDLLPRAPLTPGRRYAVVVNPDGVAPIVDHASNAAPPVRQVFTASIAEEENSMAAIYGWRPLYDSRAYGGGYHAARTAGVVATYRFTGTAVTWYTRFGPNEGRATVRIDGKVREVVDNYRPTSLMPAARGYRGLSPGPHVLQVIVRGDKSPRSTGAWVAVDGMRNGSGPLEDATYGWTPMASRSASGGRYARSATVGDRVSFTFWGTGVDLFNATGPEEGRMHLYIDGRFVRTHDNYSGVKRFGVRRTVGGLPEGVHTLTVVVAGSRHPSSRGTFVSVDRWVLRADASAFARLGAWIDLWDYNSSTSASLIQSRIDDMKARGVKTLYLQTGRYNTAAMQYPVQVGWWLDRAVAAGIRVIGWYLPAYSEYLQGDVDKTVAIASFVSPGGRRFAGLGIDIEYRRANDSKSEFFAGISSHLAAVRKGVGQTYPVAAITFAPLDMDLWPGGWSGFPWKHVATYANAAMPMGYWSNRDDRCAAGQAHYCAYEYTRQNILRTRALTGLPVHNIGGVGHGITASEVDAYVKATRDANGWGGSLYDYRTTSASWWSSLARLNG